MVKHKLETINETTEVSAFRALFDHQVILKKVDSARGIMNNPIQRGDEK